MLTTPSLSEIVEGPRGMLRGIDISVSSQCLVSAVTLMFSTVDALAALSRLPNQLRTNRNIFITWVEKYLLFSLPLPCNASDLYGARCGVLHTYSPVSGLSQYGEARPLFYQWHAGPDVNCQRDLPANAIVVEIESLQSAVKAAARAFVVSERSDEALAARVAHHLPNLLCYIPW